MNRHALTTLLAVAACLMTACQSSTTTQPQTLTPRRDVVVSQHYLAATLNLGRAKSIAPVERSMRETEKFLREKAAGRPVVLFLQEMGEGDRGYDDHELLRKYFAKWDRIHMRFQQPMMLLNFPNPSDVAVNKTMNGVPNQSPHRRLLTTFVRTSGPDLALLGGHYPAGCKNGFRPRRIKRALCAGYDNMLAEHREALAEYAQAGKFTVWGMDCNWRRFPKMHWREVQLGKRPPDYLRVVPAPGWKVNIHSRGWRPMHVEHHHGLLWAEFSLAKERP